jgi:hypothetical protein
MSKNSNKQAGYHVESLEILENRDEVVNNSRKTSE